MLSTCSLLEASTAATSNSSSVVGLREEGGRGKEGRKGGEKRGEDERKGGRGEERRERTGGEKRGINERKGERNTYTISVVYFYIYIFTI